MYTKVTESRGMHYILVVPLVPRKLLDGTEMTYDEIVTWREFYQCFSWAIAKPSYWATFKMALSEVGMITLMIMSGTVKLHNLGYLINRTAVCLGILTGNTAESWSIFGGKHEMRQQVGVDRTSWSHECRFWHQFLLNWASMDETYKPETLTGMF